MTIESLYSIFLQHPQISTDTRKITSGSLFFALKGEHFNGNKFAADALGAGAAYAVIDEPEYRENEKCILVEDVLAILQQLANYHRRQLNIPFIAITGTNGKTTTKELVNSVLSRRYRTHATAGNLNNHIGVPLTLLAITRETEIAIIEMGANHQNEIGFLCELAEPTHGLINNVGKAHLEGFGGFEGVKKGKGELYDYLKQSKGLAFVNKDNEDLMKMYRDRMLPKVIFYGSSDDCFVKGRITENNPFLNLNWFAKGENHSVQSNLTGMYNFENILAAIAVGLHFGLKPEEVNAGIKNYQPTNNRSQITKTATNTLICDYYNANPSSMEAALDNFSSINARNKVLILGDMFELGNESSREHLLILEKALRSGASKSIFIGKEFSNFKRTGGFFFETTADALELLKDEPLTNSTILIKGSRGMKLEELIKWL